MRKEKILIIDDDPDIRDVLELSLSEYYTIFSAANGKEGLEMAKNKNPDLIISDYNMPIMQGPEFVRLLRKDILMRHLPVIMLTGKSETKDMVLGIEAGADDYLVKPFEPETLLARIKMILKRTVRSLDANPLTHLPGNTSITDDIQARLDKNEPFAVGYADLDKFKIYNDKYGFEKGDEIIRALARSVVEAATDHGDANTFVGHIGGDDFVFICKDEQADAISQSTINLFDHESPCFYNETDIKNGYIEGVDRQGNATKAGLVSVSIGIVSSATHKVTHVGQIGEIAAELKKVAKAVGKSNFVRDQRKAV